MRFLRCFGDVSVGAETVRQQPELVLSPQQPSDEPSPELFAFRERAGLPRQPRNIVYSLLRPPAAGAPRVHDARDRAAGGHDAARRRPKPTGRAGAAAPPAMLVDDLLEPAGLRRAQQRLFAQWGVRYLDCEGGQTLLRRCYTAGLLDEVFRRPRPS